MKRKADISIEPQGRELWRLQCARNVMGCYGLAMAGATGARNGDERKVFEELAWLMVQGMTVVRSAEDEAVFYRISADQCRMCMELSRDFKARTFEVYADIFEDLSLCGSFPGKPEVPGAKAGGTPRAAANGGDG